MGIFIPSDEVVLVFEKGVKLFDGEKPRYKDLTAMGEAKAAGVFFLTNRKIIFVPRRSLTESILEPLTFLLSEGLIKDILEIAAEMSAGRGSADLGELDLTQGRDFLEIPLSSIKEVKAKKAYLFTNYLMVRYEEEGTSTACSFIFGQAARSKKDLEKKILQAMKESKR